MNEHTERALPVPAELRPWVTGITVATLDVPAGEATVIDEPDHATTLAARRLNISERRFRDLFTDAVGVSPRHFARLDRVRTVLVRARRAHLAQLTTEAGYYDQSHMTAEFRRVMGTPPAAFIAGRLPAATPCSPQTPASG